MTTKPGEQPLTTAPWAAPQVPLYPTSAGMSAAHHPPPPRQLSGEDTVAPWKLGGEGGAEAVPPPPVTEANLGPKRTSSPDSRLAASLDGEEAEKRRGSLGTGGVRVAETGDLSLGRKGSVVKGENE
jgi:serine/threonine-protein phosphatase 2A activator